MAGFNSVTFHYKNNDALLNYLKNYDPGIEAKQCKDEDILFCKNDTICE